MPEFFASLLLYLEFHLNTCCSCRKSIYKLEQTLCFPLSNLEIRLRDLVPASTDQTSAMLSNPVLLLAALLGCLLGIVCSWDLRTRISDWLRKNNPFNFQLIPFVDRKTETTEVLILVFDRVLFHFYSFLYFLESLLTHVLRWLTGEPCLRPQVAVGSTFAWRSPTLGDSFFLHHLSSLQRLNVQLWSKN